MTDSELIQAFDNDAAIVSTPIFGSSAPDKEFFGQCLAVEFLRSLMARGLSVDDYNNMSDEYRYAELGMEAWTRARLNPFALTTTLSITEALAAVGLGGNFFEHGYQTTIDNQSAENRITFSRTGGIVTA